MKICLSQCNIPSISHRWSQCEIKALIFPDSPALWQTLLRVDEQWPTWIQTPMNLSSLASMVTIKVARLATQMMLTVSLTCALPQNRPLLSSAFFNPAIAWKLGRWCPLPFVGGNTSRSIRIIQSNEILITASWYDVHIKVLRIYSTVKNSWGKLCMKMTRMRGLN